MRMRTILASLFLVAALVLAACGGEEAATPTPAPPTATPEPPTPVPTAAPAVEPAGETASAPAVADVRTFVIDPAQSEVRFLLNEMLLGAPTEVKGTTSALTGTIQIDLATPANTVLSPIVIDARELKTDRSMRDRAIRRFILQSGEDKYRFITFTPTSISGLPAQAQPGDSLTFEVTGDLQIREITAPVTFAVALTADSATQITGLAKATVQRGTFDLQIPNVPGVADVSEDVQLELAFVALGE